MGGYFEVLIGVEVQIVFSPFGTSDSVLPSAVHKL